MAEGWKQVNPSHGYTGRTRAKWPTGRENVASNPTNLSFVLKLCARHVTQQVYTPVNVSGQTEH
eukprot:10044216-Lingulodinium_polyedra.AAC.1